MLHQIVANGFHVLEEGWTLPGNESEAKIWEKKFQGRMLLSFHSARPWLFQRALLERLRF
jgi:hypothetical protein